MDIVYPVGPGSKWENNELRYSLRSLMGHVKYSKVFVVGIKPPWYRGIHIPFVDQPGRNVSNQVRKLELVVSLPELSDKFLWMNDDFFFTAPWKDRKLYHRHSTPKRTGFYDQAYRNARQVVGQGHDYELHFPVVYDKMRVRRILSRTKLRNIAFRTVYFHGMNSKPADDVKLFKWQEPPEPFFSTSSTLVQDLAFQQWMERAYPVPSPWE